MYDMVIIQLSGNTYFWALRQVSPYKIIATSKLIGEKYLVENEARELANRFSLPVFVEER